MSDSHQPQDNNSEGLVQRVMSNAAELGGALRAYAKDLPFGPARHNLLKVSADFEKGRVLEALNDHHLSHRDLLWAVVADLTQQDAQSALQSALQSVRHYSRRRMRVWRSFAYPLLLLVVAVAVTFFILGFVTPQFEELFYDFEVELPPLTLLVISSQPLLRAVFLTIVSLIIVGCLVPTAVYDRVLHFMPIVGHYRQCAQLAGFSRSVVALLKSGLSVPTAVERAGQCPGQPVLEAATRQLAASIRADQTQPANLPFGSTIVFALTDEMELVPRCALLHELADVYDERADKLLRWLETVYEPLLAVILGFFVVLTILALFLPLVSLIQNLS